MKLFNYKNTTYPEFIRQGFSAQYIHAIAHQFCTGFGYDVGYGKKEWLLEGAVGVDKNNDEFHALNLPPQDPDFIFSSHMLEHAVDWVEVLNYWTLRLIPRQGTLFLYLPHGSNRFWEPWNHAGKSRHYHSLQSETIVKYMEDNGYNQIFQSGIDLNYSFAVVGLMNNYIEKNPSPNTSIIPTGHPFLAF